MQPRRSFLCTQHLSTFLPLLQQIRHQAHTAIMSQQPFPIVQLKNLPFSHNPKELYELMGQFGNIQEIRVGNNTNVETRGQAIVTYTTFKAASLAVEKLSGFNYHGRYLVVKLYTPDAYLVSEMAKELNAEVDVSS